MFVYDTRVQLMVWVPGRGALWVVCSVTVVMIRAWRAYMRQSYQHVHGTASILAPFITSHASLFSRVKPIWVWPFGRGVCAALLQGFLWQNKMEVRVLFASHSKP